jgi:hypothetical protein
LTARCKKNEAQIASVLVHGAGGVEADQEKDKPLSAVFGFDVVPGSNYQKRTVHFVSNYARLQLGLSSLKSVYNSIVSNTQPSKNAELGNVFESVVYRLLQGGWKSQMTPITNKPNGPGFIEGKTKDLKVEAGSGPVHMVEGGTGFYARGYEKMKGLGRHDGPIFFGSNFLVIDAADAPNRGFSVTIAKTKTITAKALQRLRVGLGLKKPQPLHIVFLVPAGYSAPEVTLPSSTSTKWYFAAIPSPLANEEVWKEALQEPATMNPQKVLKPHKQQHVTHTSHTTTHTHTNTQTHTHTTQASGTTGPRRFSTLARVSSPSPLRTRGFHAVRLAQFSARSRLLGLGSRGGFHKARIRFPTPVASYRTLFNMGRHLWRV